ncbi:unnamed protein product [Moneuplotes crassus]|uniref:Ion transport domain-containing protein n=1 Tax=Euplotes crassus TaxID=5936 RepID=A0AAD1UG60_EUPCR|nr:unnamed protein product [Moneuplotes crassus]
MSDNKDSPEEENLRQSMNSHRLNSVNENDSNVGLQNIEYQNEYYDEDQKLEEVNKNKLPPIELGQKNSAKMLKGFKVGPTNNIPPERKLPGISDEDEKEEFKSKLMANDDPPSSSEDHHSISEEYNSDTKGHSNKSKAVYYGNSLLENLDMTAGNYRDKIHAKESQILDADDDDLVGVESDLDKLSQELNARAPIEEIQEESIEHKEQSSINNTSLFTDKDEIEMLENKKCYKLRRFYTVIKVSISGTCFKIINSPIFEGVSLVIIVLNSIFMAMEDPTNESSNSDFEVLDNVFLALYTIEMILKILGQGFIFPPKSYLRESWNILDFIIVISGYLPMFLSSNSTNLNVLRSFRVLRPLRTISGIEGLKILVSALLSAIPMLRDTILVLLFFFLIFAIAGLQLWSGVLKKRCIEIETGKVHLDNLICGAKKCPSGYFCGKTNTNPNLGITNFDNIFYSFLVIFQCVTLEGWSTVMVMLQKSFNNLAFLFFVPLVFIGAFFLLNLTLAVIKSKFTEEHNSRKKDKNFMGETPEEKELKEKKEKSRINRKIKGFIRAKLFEILEKVRKKLEPEDNSNILLRRPMSVAGALRRDIFEEDKEFNKSIVSDVNSPDEDEKEEDKEIFIKNEQANMDEESSFHASSKESEESDPDRSKDNNRSSSGSGLNSGDEGPDRRDKQINVIKSNKFISNNSTCNKMGFEKSKKWRRNLDISRGTIVEVDEEHQSETNKFMGSSEHKSSSRRFHKVINTLRGNSPNSSANVIANKDFSQSSNPYYENVDSPLIHAPRDDLKLLKIKAQKNRKKKSSKNITKRLSENSRDRIKSDRSQGAKKSENVVHLEINAEDNTLDEKDDNQSYQKEKDIDTPLENTMTPTKPQDPENEQVSSTSDLKSSEHLDYLEDVDSPISTDSNIDNFFDFEEGFAKTRDKLHDEPSIGDIQYQKSYQKICEEEKKLYVTNSQSTIRSEHKKRNNAKNENRKEFRSSRAHNSVRNHTLTRNLNNTPEELKSVYNQRERIMNPSPKKNVSTSIGHLSMCEEKFTPQKRSRFSESKQKWLQSRKMLTNKEIIHLKYDNSVTRCYEEDKDFVKNRIIEREQAKKETPWKTIADNIKNRKKLKTLNGQSKKKLASNKIKFKYSSLKDVVSEEKKEPPKAKFKWKMIWMDAETKEYEKRVNYKPQQDFSIPVEEENHSGQTQGEETIQDYDFMSRNKWLQQKYDENFHSHIISTNSVSLVAESKDMKEVDRMELVPDEIYISSDEDSLCCNDEVKIQTPLSAKPQVTNESKDAEKMGVKEVKKIMTKVLIKKTKPKNTILLSSLKRSSSFKKIPSNFKMGKQNSKRKGFIGSKKSGKLLQGSSTPESNPLRRMRKTRKLFSFKSKPTTGHYLGKIGKMNEEQIKEMVNRAIEIEETPYEERIPIKDEYLDVEFDLEGAIKKVKKEDKNRQIVDIEWSGQDIMPCLEPSQANHIINSLNTMCIHRNSGFRWLLKMKFYLDLFVRSSFFENFMTLCVTLNTLILAIDHYGIDPEVERSFNNINTVFTVVFCIEMALKILGLGIRNYLRETMNYLDGAVVILSIVELAFLSNSGGSLSAFRTVRIFRTFRVLRVARLLRSMQSMQVIIGVIGRSMSSFIYLAILLLLFIFIYSLMGMQLYGGQFNNYEGEKPRANFDSFAVSFLTVFQLLTMENWNSILYSTMDQSGWTAAIYLISWIFIGNFVLLNLFLAILLDSFVEEDEEEKKEMEEKNKMNGIVGDEDPNLDERANLEGKKNQQLIDALDFQIKLDLGQGDDKNDGKKFVRKNTKKKNKENNLLDESIEITPEILAKKESEIKASKAPYEGVECERSFFFISKSNPIRLWIYTLTQWNGFETIIMVLILLSSVKLIVDTYILNSPDDSIEVTISGYLDLFFIVAFALESLLHSISDGLVFEKGSYLRESWNQLDFFIAVTSIIDLVFDGINVPVIKVLRLLRTLRPLRFISHNSQIKIVVEAMIQSVGHIFNVLIVILVVFLMFAILGVNLFGGKFQYCDADAYEIRTREDCLNIGAKWKTYDSNFDNTINAMLTLFVVSSLEGWPDIMYQATDATVIERGPQKDASAYYSLYFIFFILVGNFFFLNFFVGVISLNYEEAQKEEAAALVLNDRQRIWIDIMKMIKNASPDIKTTYVPRNKFRKFLHSIVISEVFEVGVMTCIVLNMVQMAISFEDSPDSYNKALYIINLLFTALFTLEAILKLVAYGAVYFSSSWNKFDFFVVLSSLLEILLSYLSSGSLQILTVGPQLARVLRILRVSRLLRLINRYKGLQTLIQTITFSISSLFNVFALLLLVFFIYAILGVFIFSDITEGEIISEYKNFKNFHQAMLILLMILTGEDWNKIMYDLSRTKPDCIPEKTCGTPIAPLYFISFIMICMLVLLNLFILVILQQFDEYYLPKDNVIDKFKKDLDTFKLNWTKFSRDDFGIKIKDHFLVEFFYSMPFPLGFKGMRNMTRKTAVIEILKMDLISDNNGFIYFNELLFKTMKRVYGEENVKNISLAQQELSVLKKLKNIRKKMMKTSRNKDIDSIKVNPFLSLMYFKLSFSAWRKRTLRNQILRERGQDPRFHRLTSEDSILSSLSRSEETFKIEYLSSSDSNEEIKEVAKEESKQDPCEFDEEEQ